MKLAKVAGEKGEEMEKQVLQVQLPQELIAEILSRLPVKSLLRFKSVSKLWKNLISEPAFRLSNTEREQAIVLHMQRGRRLSRRADTASFYSLYDDLSIQKVPHPVGNVPSDYADFEFLGTCNGLILFYASRSMYLWNPLTRCSRELSQLYNFGKRWMASGLCYDKSSDDYKVILLNTRPAQPKSVYVVSLRKREILTDIGFPYKLHYHSEYHSMSTSTSGVLVSGHLHWIMKEDIGNAHLIVYFDEEINQFSELRMPEEPTPYDGCRVFGLTVLNGCLCFGSSWKNHSDVFMMKEYGVKESWTKLFTIKGFLAPLHPRISDNRVWVYRYPYIYFYHLREQSCTRLMVEPSEPLKASAYNLRNKESRKVKLEPIPLCVKAGPLIYMQSLESIPLV